MTVTVTDHAVLRYLERVCGIDVDAVRSAIASGCARGVEADAPVIRFGGARFLLRGAVVVTSLHDKTIVGHEAMTELIHNLDRCDDDE
ncbi:MAG: hypothetical protein K8H74_17975 [Notoacmeibacter sp.]|nr:hypothetical protein [Notoacmeibacter sp.]